MPISFSCPSCSKKLSVPETMAGKAAKCPCGAKLKIPATTGQQPMTQQPVAQQPSGQPVAQPLSQGNLPMAGNPAAQNPASMQPVAGAPPANFNPGFKVQCMQCGTEYPIQPHLIGQTVACRCGAPIRFEDSLGSGGMLSANPLGAPTADPLGQPSAYASQSNVGLQQTDRLKQEEDVLRTYLKDDYEEVQTAARKGKGPEGSPKAALICGIIFVVLVAIIPLGFLFLDDFSSIVTCFVAGAGLMVFAIAGLWRTFEKAGESGIACIIPIYNMIVLIRIAGRPEWWLVLIFVPVVSIVVPLILSFDVAQRFGKGPVFGIGLAFFGFIFYPILGFGTARYQGV